MTNVIDKKDDHINIENIDMTLQNIAHIPKAEIDSLYNMGYNLYSQNKYAEAEKIFQLLCMMNHNKSEYWQAAAGCQMASKDYENAINSYLMAITNDPKNITLYFWCSNCSVKSKNFDIALKVLNVALELIDTKDKKTREIIKLQIEKVSKLESSENSNE